jgi:hypothetical protein
MEGRIANNIELRNYRPIEANKKILERLNVKKMSLRELLSGHIFATGWLNQEKIEKMKIKNKK